MKQKVSKTIFDYLYQHIADIHMRKISIINSFALDYDEYMRVLEFINNYIKKFERFLGDVEITNGKNLLPFVIFGSVVGLQSFEGIESLRCCVTLPKEEYESLWTGENVSLVPCNTRSASELIFKKCGEEVCLDYGGRSRRYVIKSIEPNPYVPLVRMESC